MALNIKKDSEVKQAASVNQPNVGAPAASSNKTPIDMTVKTNDNAENKVVSDFVNSEEFKKLSPDEQLKLFKEKFCPGVSDEVAREYLSGVKQSNAIAESSGSTESSVTTTSTTAQSGDTESTVTTSTTASTSSTNTSATNEKSQLEILADAYIKKNNFKGSIDELKASLLQKSMSGEPLTKEEQALLDEINRVQEVEGDPEVTKVETQNPEQNVQESKMLVTHEQMAQLQGKSAEEKLDFVTRIYLEKNDETYATLPEEEKAEYVKQQSQRLISMLSDNYDDLSETKQNSVMDDAVALLNLAHTSGKSIDEYASLDRRELLSQVAAAKSENLVKIATTVSKALGLVEKTVSESFKIIADTVLSRRNPDYQNLSEEQKEALRNQMIKDQISKAFPGIESMPPEKRDAFLQIVKEAYVEEYGSRQEIDFSKLGALNDYQIANVLYKYTDKYKDKNPECKAMYEELGVKLEVLYSLQAQGITKPSNDQILAELERMSQDPGANPIVHEQYSAWKALKEADPEAFKEESFIVPISYDAKEALYGQQQVEAEIKDAFKQITPENYVEFKDVLKTAIKAADGNFRYIDYAIHQLKMKGLSDEQITELLGDESFVKAHAKAHGKGDAYAAARGVELSGRFCSEAAKKTGEKFLRDYYTISMDKEGMKIIGEAAVQYEDFIDPFAQGMVNAGWSKEDRLDVTNHVLTLDTTPDSSKALLAESTIEAAQVNGGEEQVFFAQELAKHDNPVIFEGIAAASDSVDKNYQAQFNAVVEQAVASYPPEVRETIRAAMTTGEVSKATLARTTTETSRGDDNSVGASRRATGNSPATSDVKTSVQTPTLTPTARTVINDTRTEVSASTDTHTNDVNTPHNSTPQVSTTSSSSEVRASETQALEAKRDAAAANALKTSDDIRQAQTEREIEKVAQEVTQSVIEELALEGEITLSEKDKIISQLKNAKSINEVYEIVSKIGGAGYFIDKLSNASAFYVTSFIKNINDPSIVADLYMRSTTQSVKKQLLKILPEDYIYPMLDSNKVANLADVDWTIIRNYLSKNLSSMSNTKFSNYLQYLPLDERERLIDQRNSARGITIATTAQTQDPDSELYAPISISTTQETQLPQANPKTPVLGADDKKAKDASAPKPKIAEDEVEATLADGTRIRRAETFAGVSDTQYEEYEEVKPIGMEDEILTPGSEEWRRKYNKQPDSVPTTAFTMADLVSDDEDTGMNFGSNRVRMGQDIKKKFQYRG